MRFTEEMRAEDEKRWHTRDVIAELGYCGNAMRDRKHMTNLDIRFYAYIARKAYDMLKAQEPVEPTEPDEDNTRYCGACGSPVGYDAFPITEQDEDESTEIITIRLNYCPTCGRAVKWE